LDDDPRNHLVKQFIKAIEIIRPKHLLMENVKGLMWFSEGKVLDEILEKFRALGYENVCHKVMKAVEFGVPQKRERVFILGSLDGEPVRFPEPLFSEESEGLPKPVTVGEAILDLPELQIGEEASRYAQYNEMEPSTYQKLMRGMINFDEFLDQSRTRHGI